MSSPPRFRDDQLARLREMSTAIECECPQHLTRLVTALLAFEDYSQTCAAKDTPDASLHRMMREKAELARIIMEDALSVVLKHERILL